MTTSSGPCVVLVGSSAGAPNEVCVAYNIIQL